MKIFNIHLKPAKILSTITIVIAIIFVFLAIVGISKQILAKNHIEITNTNYTNILVDAYENIDNYIGKNITITGYIFRLPEFGSNEFVIARDMLVDENHSQVVGFLCNYNQISQYETNSWVKITGTIEKGTFLRRNTSHTH